MFCTPTNCPEIIQLVEVDAPLSRVPCSSASSSSSYWWSSSDGTDENETEIEEDEKKDEGYCESYCSSDDEDEAIDSNDPSMNRVLAWRSSFDSVYGADEDVFQSLKRKYGASEDLSYDSDSSSSQSCQRRRLSISSPAHICSACDTSFATLHHLQHHASQDAEACRVAVQYGFES